MCGVGMREKEKEREREREGGMRENEKIEVGRGGI